MFIRRPLIVLSAIALAACNDDPTPAMDAALQQDLSLANQAFAPQQFVSPLEAGMMPNGYVPAGYAPQGYVPAGYVPAATVQRPATRTVRRTGGTVTSSGTTVRKNTKRDAAIGAVTGAAIGAVTTSRKDRMKGAVIGAVAGAVLGGVIGNNVDLTKVPRQ